jgi:hypothetical protein
MGVRHLGGGVRLWHAERDEAREIIVEAAEAIVNPGANARLGLVERWRPVWIWFSA